MTCALNLYTDYLLSSTAQTSATDLSRLFDGHISHDQTTRWRTSVYLDSRQAWTHVKSLIRQTERELAADYVGAHGRGAGGENPGRDGP